jgi:hypothetical protein
LNTETSTEENVAEAVEPTSGLTEGRSVRDEMLAAIVERRRSEIAENTGGLTDHEAAPIVEDLPIRRDGERWVTKVKVNGEESEVEFDEVVKRYQKDNAADKRLAEVSYRQKQLDQYAARLEQRDKELREKFKKLQQVPRPTGAAVPSNVDARKLTEALYSGDEDAATKAFEALLARTRQETPAGSLAVDEDAIVGKLRQRLDAEKRREQALEFERKRQEAVVRFQEEYKDIADDPYLNDMADNETLRVMKEGSANDPWEILKVSGDRVRDWLSKRSPESRDSRKRSAAAVAGAARARANLTPEDNSPRTTSDIIAEMRKSRGQTV